MNHNPRLVSDDSHQLLFNVQGRDCFFNLFSSMILYDMHQMFFRITKLPSRADFKPYWLTYPVGNQRKIPRWPPLPRNSLNVVCCVNMTNYTGIKTQWRKKDAEILPCLSMAVSRRYFISSYMEYFGS